MILATVAKLTNCLVFKTKGITLTRITRGLDGEDYYEYEVIFSVNTSKVLMHDLSHIDVRAVLGSHSLPNNMSNTEVSSISKGSVPQLVHAQSTPFGNGFKVSTQLLDKKNRKVLASHHISPGKHLGNKEIPGDLIIGSNYSGGSKNEVIVAAVIGGFGKAVMRAAKKRAKVVKVLDHTKVSIHSQMSAAVRDKAVNMRRGPKNDTSLLPRPTIRKVHASNFALPEISFQFMPAIEASKRAQGAFKLPYHESVIDHTRRETKPPSKGFPQYTKPPPGVRNQPSVSPAASNNLVTANSTKPKTIMLLPRQYDMPSNNIRSTTVFNSERDHQNACLRAIFCHSVPPTAIIPVNVDASMTSTMDAYQGTSNIKNNGY